MNLLEIAQQDKAFTLNDNEFGFATKITLTDPSLHSAVVPGRSNDISFAIDPNTGTAVSGRTATIEVDMNILTNAGFSSLPSAKSKTEKPWKVEWTDQQGNSHSFIVLESNPDRTLGVVFCTLQFYK